MNVLAPLAWTLFEDKPALSRIETVEMVNRAVNMIPSQRGSPPSLDEYRIWPYMAWCHDYAVTKRAELLLRGFDPKDCLLCECEAYGISHMVLIVDGFVLDNLTPKILPKADVRYPWRRCQSPDNPDFWVS